ncbi:MAG: DUF4260 domain-containing protein [Anaerolineales bacterium]|nr:DUF4260 domain-containing protein [Anaerolineales bacterium]
MKTILRLEELLLFGLAIYLFAGLPHAWWWFPLLLLTPDLGMLGYLANPRWGAATYNLTHHKGLAVALFLIGAYLSAPTLQLVGVVMFGHSSLDRVFGYGLKRVDSFHHTHLGWIGGQRPAGEA